MQLPDPSAQQRYYAEALDQVLKAEQLGFDSVWFTEHHFTRHGIVSATMSVLAYLAGLTTTIRLGTAVSVLPFHNPIQLAEEGATVDLQAMAGWTWASAEGTSGASITGLISRWMRLMRDLPRLWR